MTTPLAETLLARMRLSGPLNMADYMAECLMHPKHGYYSTRDPFGQQGDFTTAPEISQMFGELLGLLLAQVWLDQGQPTPFTLAELGPGRGTLMADVLRATAIVPGFQDAAQVCLVEVSPHLQQIQAQTLSTHPVTWLEHAGALPQGPLFLLANEFFDALPIRQFTRHRDGWQEHLIAARGTGLVRALSDPHAVPEIDHRLADTSAGDVVETCAPAVPIMGEIASRIETHGGVAIVIDYGGWHSLGETLQALQSHGYQDPLSSPGQADLTAHVDFEALVRAAPGVCATGLTNQGQLLERLGIRERHRALAQNLTGASLDDHNAALKRLTEKDEMGTLFKAVGFYPKTAPPPPGFDS